MTLSDCDFDEFVERSEKMLREEGEAEPGTMLYRVSLLERGRLRHHRLGSRGDPELRERALSRLHDALREGIQTDGHSLEKAVHRALDRFYRRLPSYLGAVLSLDPVLNETAHSLEQRDKVAFTMTYLNREAVSRTLRQRVEGLDAVLYETLRVYGESYKNELRSLSHDRYPDTMWWRRLEPFTSNSDSESGFSIWHRTDSDSGGPPIKLRQQLQELLQSEFLLGYDGPSDLESDRVLHFRDEIERTLQKHSSEDWSITFRDHLDGIDSVLYNKYSVQAEFWDDCSVIKDFDAPDEFWWRHPEQFRPGTEGPHVELWHERTPE